MTIQQLVRHFIACKGNALAAKRLYRSLARTLHPDKGGTTAEFQALEDIYAIAKKGESGLTQLHGRVPKKIRIHSKCTDLPHRDKLGVFKRSSTETVQKKPIYVKRDDPTIAIWWAAPDTYYPLGMWLLGRYDKRGQDCAYHIMAAREQCLEKHSDLDATDARRCETFCASSGAFQRVNIEIQVEEED